jgi:hypothetical protein
MKITLDLMTYYVVKELVITKSDIANNSVDHIKRFLSHHESTTSKPRD